MPVKPKIVTLTNSSVDILNAIRNSATTNYRNYVPVATADSDSIREIGAVIMDMPSLQNEFLSALINRIGKVILTSKMYQNPWAFFKRGLLEFGEVVEEIFVNIAKPFTFDAEESESTLFKREIPNVHSTFHVMNYQKFYKQTISEQQLKQAFLSIDGVTDLISKIIESMYTAANYDEFQTMKYMLARRILNGQLYPITVPTATAENAKTIISTIKGASNNLEFLSDKYNIAGVHNSSPKSRQYLIVDSRFDSIMDVEVLASAFNMDKAEFMGKRVLTDGFGNLDTARLAELFKGDNTYHEISDDEMQALSQIPAILVDEDFFMIFDNMYYFTDNYNGQGLYWQYFYHVWKTFSISPFAPAMAFVTGTPTVSAISVSPSVASVNAGQSISFSANVDTEFFAPQTVIWSVNSENASINASGVLTLNEGASGEITVTATSAFNSGVKGTATVTVNPSALTGYTNALSNGETGVTGDSNTQGSITSETGKAEEVTD